MEGTRADLLADLADGDVQAWQGVVDSYAGLLWAIARARGLGAGDAADVVQTTWLRLFENARSVRDAERLRAWLAVTARREALRVLGLAGRSVLVSDDAQLEPVGADAPVDELVLLWERDAALWQACESLPSRCSRLLRLLFADPAPSYAEIAATLGIPVGSIGPTRARCLDCLRRRKEVRQELQPDLR